MEDVLKIGIPKEITQGETRVGLIPNTVSTLVDQGHEVYVEAGAGVNSYFNDGQYEKAGAKIVKDAAQLYERVDVLFKVRPPKTHPSVKQH